MLKRILSKILFIILLCTTTTIFTSCSENLPQINLSTQNEVLPSDYSIVFMFSQVNRSDIEILGNIDALHEQYGFKTETIILNDDSMITSKLRTVVENNTDLVIGYGQGMAIVFDLFQDTYPNTKFVVIDGISQDEDIKSIYYDTETISYALGVMIATAFDNVNDFAYIGDFENDNNTLYKSGFIKGLKSINKNASIDIDYIESSTDTSKANELVEYYHSIGVKFIMNATNPTLSKSIYQACLDLSSDGNSIFTNSIQSYDINQQNPHILSGIVKDYNSITQSIVEDFINNKFSSTNIKIDVGDESFNLIDVSGLNTNSTNTQVLNDNSIKSARKVLDDIKNKNLNI